MRAWHPGLCRDGDPARLFGLLAIRAIISRVAVTPPMSGLQLQHEDVLRREAVATSATVAPKT
jgi:hypothetical protein